VRPVRRRRDDHEPAAANIEARAVAAFVTVDAGEHAEPGPRFPLGRVPAPFLFGLLLARLDRIPAWRITRQLLQRGGGGQVALVDTRWWKHAVCVPKREDEASPPSLTFRS
jgi:hypothetical protein